MFTDKSEKFSCVNIATILITIISTVLGIVLVQVSSFVLYEGIQLGNGSSGIHGNTSKIFAALEIKEIQNESIFRMEVPRTVFLVLIYWSGTALVAGSLQFVVSLLVSVTCCRGGLSRGIIVVWIVFHVVILLALSGSYTNLLSTYTVIPRNFTRAIELFLPFCIVEQVIILVSLAFQFVFLVKYL